MCLLLIAVDVVPNRPRLLLGNRDEFHGRASAAAAAWPDAPGVVGGRDLVAGGSWLALRADGRFAAVTNVRSGLPATAPKSRGALVRDFVVGDSSARDYLSDVRANIDQFGPFNLVVGDRRGVFCLDWTSATVIELTRGVHVVSNGAFGVHWPKTDRLQRRFEQALREGGAALFDDVLLDLLADDHQPDDSELPETGVGLEHERLLAPIFIRGERYGTRASSLVSVGDDGRCELIERRFGPNGVGLGQMNFVVMGDAVD